MEVQLSEKRRLALLVACGEHVLPLTFFESNFTKEMLKLSAVVRLEDIRAEISLVAQEMEKELRAEIRGSFITLMADG